MKKLLFIAVFSLFGLAGVAQVAEEEINVEKQEEVNPETSAKVNVEGNEVDEIALAGYSEAMIDDLPGEVTTALEKNYPKANIHKAFWHEEKMIYRLDVTQEDSSPTVLYLDKEGTFTDEH